MSEASDLFDANCEAFYCGSQCQLKKYHLNAQELANLFIFEPKKYAAHFADCLTKACANCNTKRLRCQPSLAANRNLHLAQEFSLRT